MSAAVDTSAEAVEAMANSCATTALAQKQRGLCCGETDCGGTCCAPACLFGETMRDLTNAAALLRALLRERDEARRLAQENDASCTYWREKSGEWERLAATARAEVTALQEALTIRDMQIATVRADALKEAAGLIRAIRLCSTRAEAAAAIEALIQKEPRA